MTSRAEALALKYLEEGLTRLHRDHLASSYARGASVTDTRVFQINAQGYLRNGCEFIVGQVGRIRKKLGEERDASV
jgi:hypothetical protein